MNAVPTSPHWRAALERVPGCGQGPPLSCELLAGGSVNATYRVRSPRGEFVVRLHPPYAAELGVDRRREAVLHAAAAGSGLAPRIIAADPDGCFLVTEYIAGGTWSSADLHDPAKLALLAAQLLRLHRLPVPEVAPFDPGALIDAHVEYLVRHDPRAAAELEPLAARARTVLAAAAARRPPCIVHNDLTHTNLIGPGAPVFVDFEYAAVADPLFDLACLVAYCPQAARHAPLLIAGCGLSPLATPGELAAAAWVYRLLTRLWRRRCRLAAGAPHAGPAD